ncbi:MAG: NADH-quinone oxidoreductase subunit J, partial [Bacteroidota bacterium]
QAMEAIIFYFFVSVGALAAIGLVLSRHILYSAFLLLLVFLSVAAVYIFAGAGFLGITQIVIYVGGILVLLLFGIMLTHRPRNNTQLSWLPHSGHHQVLMALLIGFSLFFSLFYMISQANLQNRVWIQKSQDLPSPISQDAPHLGLMLMTNYVFLFELAGLLLLIVLIGASFIASNRLKSRESH